MRNLGSGWLILLLVLICGSASKLARAEPYFAQREGFKCGKCHVNHTGGGKRTPFGYLYSQTYLGMAPPTSRASAGQITEYVRTEKLFDPQLNDFISVGANLRLGHSVTFAKDIRNNFENQEANLYGELDLFKYFVIYADLSLAGGSVAGREAFLLASIYKGLYFKGGYILPPFGLRIWGDDEYTRRETGYNYASPDLGLELGYDGRWLSLFASLTNGSGGRVDVDNFKKVSLLAEASFAWARVGLSGSFNSTDAERRHMGGLYLGTTLGRLTLLGEADVIYTHFRPTPEKGGATVYSLVAYGEADFLIWRGIVLKAAFGYHDPDLNVNEDQRFTLRAGLQLFPWPLVSGSIFYTLRESVPQDEKGNADMLMTELHFYF